jgi:hypothetical protein
MKRFDWARSALAATALLIPALSDAYELRPGRIRDPAGLQLFTATIYNPLLDDYLLLYGDGRALAGHLSPLGVFSGEAVLSANVGVTHVNAAFNPDDGTFLVVYRDGDSPSISGRYLTSNGTPIGNAFSIGPGGGPNIDFSPESGRYVVTWEQLTSGYVRYRVINGDSTSASPNVTPVLSVASGLSDGLAYGSVADKFLVVYIRDTGGTAKANIYGRFITSNGLSLGPEFTIAGGFENQQGPRVAYASSNNRWMVVWENWADCGGGCPHVRGALVGASGAVVKSFTVVATPGWDAPGALGYNPVTDTFVAGWRSAFSDTNIQARAGEFSPVDGSSVRPSVLLSDLNAGVEDVAVRPDADNPQAMFLWRIKNGGDGVHAGIINLRAPEPDTIAPAKVTDLSGEASPGGTAVAATAIASTRPGPSSLDMTKTTDGSPSTYWASPDRNAITQEFITWDLGSAKSLSQVSLLSRSTGNLFPVDYQIQVSTDNVSFTTAFSVTGASVAAGTWVDHVLPEPTARYVKLLVTKTKRAGTGKYRAEVAEVEIVEAADGAAVKLEWTAPGDDGSSGTAAAYDLRWSSTAITNANFGAATTVSAPKPSLAGTGESVALSGFPRESLVYFALKSRDEASNVSELSNVISVATPGLPPAAVQGFTASNPTGSSVDLSWQPSGDDGNAGNSSSYDVRYSTSPIHDGNFSAAASVIRPATSPKPAFERYTVRGLASQATYYFAIKALDELGNASLINGGGPVSATTLDAVAPSATTDLAVRGRTSTKLNATAVAASGEAPPAMSKAKAVDGNLTSIWSTPGRSVQQPEFITLDLGGVRTINRVTLLSPASGAFFPQDLEVQISTNNFAFSTVERRVDIPVTKAMLHTFEFPTVSARYVRIYVTKTRLSGGGQYFARIAEIEVWEAITSYFLTLTWTEPGDDGTSGKAALYDIRSSRSPITSEALFNGATPLDGEPTPASAGASASFSFEPPDEGFTLYFRMKAFDDAGNASPLSNEASALVASVPPAAVQDLTVFKPTSSSIDLSWTSTGDDQNSGTATSLDVRYSTSPIDEGNFDSAAEVANEPLPAVAGTRQQMTVSGLAPSTNYFFAMKVEDETSTPSAISNVVSVATDAPDTTPPAAVTDLRGSVPFNVTRLAAPAVAASSVESASAGFAKASDGISTSYWMSMGRTTQAFEWITLDTGFIHNVGEVRLLSRPAAALFPEDLQIQVSDDNVSFTTVWTATGLPSTMGMLHSFTFPAASGRYVRIYITKTRKSGGGFYVAQIAEIQVFDSSFVHGPVTLNWTAPGDDGGSGTSASYDLRYSTSPIVDLNTFLASNQVSGEPAPRAAGSLESMEVSLPPGTYYFAVRATDEASNDSGVSNVPTIVVP